MKAGKELENYVQFVYQKLLDFMDEGAMVSSNVSVIGKSGVKHEFDVYYEFQHLNMRHRIAIECKDWNTPVSKGEVGEFLSKLNDLNNISGMMVAKSGYQEGAKQFAESNGIHLMETKDLPSLGEIVAGVIKEAFLPDEATQGAPFWTLMEIQSGEITGTYFSLPEGKPIVPFFYSKVIAEKMREKLLDAENWVVRGVSQYQLKGFVAQMEVLGVEAAVFYLPYCKELSNTRKCDDLRRYKNMIKILFVCHGNICRSTMAEYVMKYLVEQAELSADFYIDSAATSREEIGNGVHRGTRKKLKEVGIPCGDHRARQMTRRDYDEFDYLIGMESWNIRNMLRIVGDDPEQKIYKLLDFTDRKGEDIADPWYTGNFDATYRDVREGCEALLAGLVNR